MKMKWMKKNIIACLLIAIMLCSTLGAAVYYARASTYEPPAVVLLESMLNGDRQWVIDTIVEDDRTNNPYVLNPSEMSLMAKALSQYENENDPDYNALFSLLVDALTKYYYTGLWATDLGDNELTAWAEEHPAEMLLLFGGSGAGALILLVGQLKNLAETEQFDNILFSVFQDTYTSSWGESINEQELMLQQLNEVSDTLSNLKDLTGYWSALYGVESEAEEAEGVWQFMEKVATPLYDSGADFLKAFNNLQGGEQAAVSAALLIASKQCAYNWLTSESRNYNDETVKNDLKKYIIGTDESKLLKIVGSGFEWSSTLISQYSFLHSLLNQKELFQGTVTRMADQANIDGQENMSRILTNYAAMMDTALESDKLQLVTVLRTLSSMAGISKNTKISTIYDKTVKFVKDNGYKNVPFSSISSVFDVGMSVVDGCTGLKETCLKTYELIYLRDIITEAKKVYQQDLLNYNNDQTEENANKVLMDILMIQRLRLKGENIAYKMTKGQLNSWMGKLLSGANSGSWAENILGDTDLAEAWTEHYQRSVDALIGATICPVAGDSFQVAQGEELFILYDSEKNTYRARYTTGGKDIMLYEMQYRVMNGIKVNGGSVTVTGVSVPFIVATGASTIAVDRTAQIGEITQSGSCTLELYNGQSAENYTLEVPYTTDLQSATVKLNGNTIDTSTLTLTDNIVLENGDIVADELVMNGATVTGGNITCSGNVSKVGSEANAVSSLILNGTEEQTVAGTLNVGNLTLNNSDDRAISINGTVNVSGILNDPENRVTSGLVLTNTAQIQGNTVASDIILDGTQIPKEVKFKNGVTVRNNATFTGGTIGGFLQAQNAEINNIENPLVLKKGIIFENVTVNSPMRIDIYETAALSNTVFNGEGEVTLYASDVTGTENTFKTLNICGDTKQQLSLGGIAEKLLVVNKSISGVTLSEELEVTEVLTLEKQKITGGENLIVTAQTAIDVDATKTNLTIKDWTGTWNGSLSGTVYLSGNTVFTDEVIVDGIVQDAGSLRLVGAKVNTKGLQRKSTDAIFIDVASSLYVSGDSYVASSIENEGVLTIAGSLDLDGNFTGNGALITLGYVGQTIDGTDIYVGTYTNQNNSLQGVQLNAQIYASESYVNEGHIRGKIPILSKGYNYAGDTVLDTLTVEETFSVNGDLTVNNELVIEEGMKFVVKGDLTVNGSFTVTKNSTVEIEGNMISKSNTISIEEGAKVTVHGNLVGTSTTATNNGTWEIWQDCKLSGGSVGGAGRMILRGDLENTGSVNGLECLEIAGKVPQEISGNAIHVNQLVIQNDAKSGVNLSVTIYYKEECIIGESCNVNEEKIMEAAE